MILAFNPRRRCGGKKGSSVIGLGLVVLLVFKVHSVTAEGNQCCHQHCSAKSCVGGHQGHRAGAEAC